MLSLYDAVANQIAVQGREAFDQELLDVFDALPDPKRQPISDVRWVPIEKVRANDYNPNRVPSKELDLLHTSIAADGYTQPVVAIEDDEAGHYVIVDGFHRWRTMVERKDIHESTGGLLPIVVIDKPIAERMASTVRHNRARGKHGVGDMAQIVFSMLDEGLTEAEVCTELGMSVDELIRLKHVSGFSKLFADVEYRRAWETRRQVQLKRDYRAEHPEEVVR
jgi:ParB-like chromosome segregation protein Spo0J